jgi:hypothetical protein
MVCATTGFVLQQRRVNLGVKAMSKLEAKTALVTGGGS